jgi:hypothetical protein
MSLSISMPTVFSPTRSSGQLIRSIAGLLAWTGPRRSAELVNTGRMASPVLQHLCVLAGVAGRLSTAGGRKLRP